MQIIAHVSYERHGSKYWQRPNSFAFAVQNQFAPIVGRELSEAVLSFPLCFVKQEEYFQLTALLSPVPEENYYVGPGGRWVGRYIPSCFKWYPFCLERVEGSDRIVLCMDESSGLLSDTGGESFFLEKGKLSKIVSDVMNQLTQDEKSRTVTDLAVAALADAGLIVPWDLKVKIDEQEIGVSEIYRIDDAKLNDLNDDSYLALRKAHSFPLAYGQLFSMGHVRVFQKLAELRKQMQPKVDIDELFGEEDIFKY